MEKGLYRMWREPRLLQDEEIMDGFKEIAARYDYTVRNGFGLTLEKNRKPYQERPFATADYYAGEFCVNTVSSHWNMNEATVFLKQMQEATELAAELNMYLSDLDFKLKKEFEKEMAEREQSIAK